MPDRPAPEPILNEQASEEPKPARSDSRRELIVAALLCAAGAVLTVSLVGRDWATVVEHTGAGTMPLTQNLTGRALNGVIAALGWAGLAGLAALVATRGWVRSVVGVLLVAFGAGIAYASAGAVTYAHVLSVAGDKSNFARLGSGVSVSTNVIWAGSVLGGVLLIAAGAFTIVRGHRWPGMSARYDRTDAAPAPAAVSADDPVALWKSLDRGEDPTGSGSREPGEP